MVGLLNYSMVGIVAVLALTALVGVLITTKYSSYIDRLGFSREATHM